MERAVGSATAARELAAVLRSVRTALEAHECTLDKVLQLRPCASRGHDSYSPVYDEDDDVANSFDESSEDDDYAEPAAAIYGKDECIEQDESTTFIDHEESTSLEHSCMDKADNSADSPPRSLGDEADGSNSYSQSFHDEDSDDDEDFDDNEEYDVKEDAHAQPAKAVDEDFEDSPMRRARLLAEEEVEEIFTEGALRALAAERRQQCSASEQDSDDTEEVQEGDEGEEEEEEESDWMEDCVEAEAYIAQMEMMHAMGINVGDVFSETDDLGFGSWRN